MERKHRKRTGSVVDPGPPATEAPAAMVINTRDVHDEHEDEVDSFELVEFAEHSADQPNPAVIPKAFTISLATSPLGMTAGAAAASLTFTVMNQAVVTTADATGATIRGAGYLIERGAAYFGGEVAGMGVFYARNMLADGAKSNIKMYAPITAVIASAVVGTTTAYAITAGSAIARSAGDAVVRAYHKYRTGLWEDTTASSEQADDNEK